MQHRRFRPVRCISYAAEGGAHLLQDIDEPSAEVGQHLNSREEP